MSLNICILSYFDEDDKIWYRDGIEGTVRDNVIFEYGLFMGKLGKQKVVIANKKKPKLATDLKGITYIDANKGEAEVKLQLKEWLIHKIERSKSAERFQIEKQAPAPMCTTSELPPCNFYYIWKFFLGCFSVRMSRCFDIATWVYISVILMELWPSISWM